MVSTAARTVAGTFAGTAATALSLLALPVDAHADIVLDPSFLAEKQMPGDPPISIRTTSNSNGTTTFHLDENVGLQRGSNLFHSFSDFDVGTTDVASFEPPPGTSLVLARINSTDGAGMPRSNVIAGTVQLQTPGARLMLINSAGMTFLEGAQLDLSGSLTISTADQVFFLDGSVVPMRGVDTTGLTFAAPSHFGFFGEPGAIEIAAGLLDLEPTSTGSEPNTLSIVGNSVSVRSVAPTSRTLRAFGGRIEIVAVPNGTIIPLDVGDMDLAIFENAPEARVDLEGDAIALVLEAGSFAFDPQPPGGIVIRGGRVEIVNTRLGVGNIAAEDPRPDTSGIDIRADTLILDGSTLQSFTQRGGRSADIQIGANQIELVGGSEIQMISQDGASGGIEIEGLRPGDSAREIHGSGASRIFSTTSGTDRGGDISVAADRLTLTDLDTGIAAASDGVGSGAGDAGNITLTLGRLEVSGGAQVAAITSGDGDAGVLDVTATDSIRLSGRVESRPSGLVSTSGASVAVVGAGDGGAVLIETPVLEVENGAEISARSFGSGAAGEITLTGLDRLTLRGGELGASTISARTAGGGAGALTVRADRVELLDGGRLTVSTSGSGNAGTLSVETDDLLIEGRDPAFGNTSGLFASTIVPFGGGTAGTGGRIEVVGARTVELRDGGAIEATSTADGDAGEIDFIGVDHVVLREGSGIRTSATSALGGNIDLGASEQIQLRRGSEITTRVASGTGQGGNIDLDTRILTLENSRITADADEGNGGNINITSLLVTQSGASPDATQTASRITASSRRAINGTIRIFTPDADLTGSLAPLAEERLLEDPLRATPCDSPSARATRSRLQIGTREARRPGPTDWRPSWAADTTGVPEGPEQKVDTSLCDPDPIVSTTVPGSDAS